MRLHNVSEDTNIGSNCQVISDAVIDSLFQGILSCCYYEHHTQTHAHHHRPLW